MKSQQWSLAAMLLAGDDWKPIKSNTFTHTNERMQIKGP
jgi:hypothetical protein